jgi:cold shock CspA family protein
MKIPLAVDFRNMDRSPALEARARTLAASLEKFGSEIIRCHVTIEVPHRHQHQGKLYAASLRITVPGREIAISRAHPADHAHENAYVALRDTFRAAQRCLQDYERERRGDVKTHAERPHGRICEIDQEGRFGRIETDDGRLVYFHGNSVLGRGFEELGVGQGVRFVEERGDLGPQASTVYA